MRFFSKDKKVGVSRLVCRRITLCENPLRVRIFSNFGKNKSEKFKKKAFLL